MTEQKAAPSPAAQKIAVAYKKAQALQRAGRVREAAQGYAAIARAAPQLAEPRFQLGLILLGQGDATAALTHLDAAQAIKPEEPAILSARAAALGALDRADEALTLYDQLIKAQPRAVRHRAEKALLLQRMGQFDDAEAELRRALKKAPKDGILYRMLLATKKVNKGEPLLRDMLTAHADPEVKGEHRMQLGFALAKAMADTSQPDRVFRYLNPANAAMRSARPYDVSTRQQEVAGLINAFTGADFSPVADPPAGPTPIFVTGLPRSGTTLVEQILAAHPAVSSGGERRFVLEEAYRLMGKPGAFKDLATLEDTSISGFGQAYLDALSKAVPGAGIITDKSIQSHLVLGLIAKALPDARLIVVRRDPRDLGLSIYRNIFAPGTHLYAYDQADIAAYVASFEQMIAFWREAIPGRFTEISYEALVADPETQTRQLVSAAGLEWDNACLNFHERGGQVATLSIQQVRQPITQTAKGGWQRYEAELQPMLEAFAREGVSLP